MYNQEQIRADQAAEAKRRTLGVSGNRDSRNQSAGRKPFVAKGHDAILKGVQDQGGMVEIQTINGDGEVCGRLIARDKYTITIELTCGKRKTFYKHAIEFFSPVVHSKVQ